MLNIFGWRAYTLPVEGRPVKVSNRSQQVLVECNKRQGITYTQVNREVFLTFPLGDARHADGQCQMLYTKNETEDIEYWTPRQHLIPAANKDGFFLELLWRVPPIIYVCNPETASACLTNIWLRETLGTADLNQIGAFCDKYITFVRGVQGRCFPYLMLSYISSVSHPLLPMEIRVGAYLSIIGSYLQTGIILKAEEIPSFPMVTGEMMESLGTPITSNGMYYQSPSAKTDKLMEKQERRRNMPGFWTDLLCHYRCIVCGMMMTMDEERGYRKCENNCLEKEPSLKCSLCDTIMIGEGQIVLHFTTMCKRPVGEMCPVCAGKPMSGSCTCQAISRLVHQSLRNLINANDNPLFRADNLEIISSILYQHYAGNLTYAPLEAKETDFSWWQVDKVRKADYGYEVTGDDIANIIKFLPTLSKDSKLVTFPGTGKIVAVETLRPRTVSPTPVSRPVSPEPKSESQGIPHWMGGGFSSDGSFSSQDSPSLKWEHERFGKVRDKEAEGKKQKKESTKEKKHKRIKEGEKDRKKEPKFKKDKEGGDEKKEREKKEEKEESREKSSDEGSSEDKSSEDEEEDADKPRDKDDDDDDDDDDEDERSSSKGRTRRRKEGDRHKCRNETHKRPKLFSSSLEKLRHVIQKHKCPYSSQGCKYYNEFDKKIQIHVGQVHDDTDWQECEVEKCSQKFSTKLLLAHHKEIHPKCMSCQKHFYGAEELKEHHPCFNLRAEKFPERREKGGAYLSSIPTNEVDIVRSGSQDPNVQLANSMAKLCQLIPMDPTTKDTLVESFKKFAALQLAQQNLDKYPASSRKMTRLLLEPPCFEHLANQKENLGKVSDFLGKDVEIWSPSNSPRSQFRNYLTLSELNEKMVAATAACKLLESSACCLLLQRFSVTAKNAIESRCFSPPSTWTYVTILQYSQDLYYCLNLEEVAIEAEESRKKEGEHLCEYASRAYKLLSTAALGRETEEKEKYIKSNLRRLVFRALPPKLRTKVDNLELRFGISYTSKDLLDFYKTEQLEQSHLRGDSMADTSLIEPQKIQVVKKEKQRKKDDPKEGQNELEKKQKDKRPKGATRRIANLVQESKLGAVGQLHPSKPILTPRPPYAAQGTAQGPKDLFNQAAKASSKMEYIRRKKAQLGIGEDDRRAFCFKCGAEGDDYHVAGKCKLPNTEEVHQCGDGQKLFHSPANCPRKKPLRSIRVVKV